METNELDIISKKPQYNGMMENPNRNLKYSYGQVVETVGCGKAQVIMLFIVGMISFSYGTLFVFSQYLNNSLICDWQLGEGKELGYMTMVLFAKGFGSILFGLVSDMWGRKKSLLISEAIVAVFMAASCGSIEKEIMMPMQFIALVGCGGLIQCGVYVFEILPVKNRLHGIAYLAFTFGLGGCLSVVISTLTAETDLRITIGAHSVLPFVGFFMTFLMPEAPMTSFLKRDNEEDALHLITIAAVMNKKELPSGSINIGKDFRLSFKTVLCNSIYLKFASLIFVLLYLVSLGGEGAMMLPAFLQTEDCSTNITLNVRELMCLKTKLELNISYIKYPITIVLGMLLALLLGKFLRYRICIIALSFINAFGVFLYFICKMNLIVPQVMAWCTGILSQSLCILFTVIVLASFPSRIRGLMYGFATFFAHLGVFTLVICCSIDGVSLTIPISLSGCMLIIAGLIAILLPTECEKRPLF